MSPPKVPLAPDDLRRLQVCPSLETRELGVGNRRQDDSEERLADTRNAAEQQVAGVDLPLLVLVVRRRDLREQDDVRQRLFRVVPDECIPRFGHDGLVQIYGFLKFRMHER